ncbi:MAG: DUF5050 domain-containing protein [Oscillospiraceae bacterium]|nr:DUF5050 domain-containing protein [Oscillospiraceae bacterium]
MKKLRSLIALTLCTLLALTVLSACGGGNTPAPAPDDSEFIEEPEDTGDSGIDIFPASEAPVTSIAMGSGYNCGFVMDVPEGFAYNDAWSCYENSKTGVRIWVVDSNFYEKESEFEGAKELSPGVEKAVATKELPAVVYEEPDGFYGAMSHYFVKLGDYYDDWFGCHLLVSSEQGDMASTQSPEVVACLDTIRKEGETVGTRTAPISQPDSQSEEPAVQPKDPYESLSVDFSPAESARMNNFVNGGYYAFEGDTTYGRFFSSDYSDVLARVDFKKDGTFADVESSVVLDTCCPTCLTVIGGDVYYIRDGMSICKVPKSGGEVELVVYDAVDYLQEVGGRLFYCNSDYRLCSAELDGSGERVVFDREVYYPYFVNDEWFIYQDDADGESIHLRHLESGEDVTLSPTSTYSPIIYGKYLYCTAEQGADRVLAKINMSDFSIEYGDKPVVDLICIDADGYLYCGTDNGLHVDLWRDAENASGEYSMRCPGVSEDYEIFWTIENDYITGIRVMRVSSGAGQGVPFVD